ncbi:MAG: MerR family transcriptional regulator [Thermodesulfobacteriota bacterium]
MSQAEADPAGLMTIRQVAQETGLAPSTIRYYDQQFEEFLGVSRGAGRRRLFSPQAVERLLVVQRLLKDEGLSLRQARQSLASGLASPAAQAAPTAPPDAELEKLRAELAGLKAEVAGLDRRLRDMKEIQERTLALVAGLTRA